jgi:hypothetical protein
MIISPQRHRGTEKLKSSLRNYGKKVIAHVLERYNGTGRELPFFIIRIVIGSSSQLIGVGTYLLGCGRPRTIGAFI